MLGFCFLFRVTKKKSKKWFGFETFLRLNLEFTCRRSVFYLKWFCRRFFSSKKFLMLWISHCLLLWIYQFCFFTFSLWPVSDSVVYKTSKKLRSIPSSQFWSYLFNHLSYHKYVNHNLTNLMVFILDLTTTKMISIERHVIGGVSFCFSPNKYSS